MVIVGVLPGYIKKSCENGDPSSLDWGSSFSLETVRRQMFAMFEKEVLRTSTVTVMKVAVDTTEDWGHFADFEDQVREPEIHEFRSSLGTVEERDDED